MLGMNDSTEAKQLMSQHGMNRLYKAAQTQVPFTVSPSPSQRSH